MNETITIILPLPPKVLQPNHTVGSRGGRFAKAAATKKYRRMACEAAQSACVETGPWELAEASVRFFHATKRRRDEDNAMGCLKAAYDGIVDAGIVVDDDSTHLRREMPVFAIDPLHPRVEITVTRLQ